MLDDWIDKVWVLVSLDEVFKGWVLLDELIKIYIIMLKNTQKQFLYVFFFLKEFTLCTDLAFLGGDHDFRVISKVLWLFKESLDEFLSRIL